jgi:hypothetical protein
LEPVSKSGQGENFVANETALEKTLIYGEKEREVFGKTPGRLHFAFLRLSYIMRTWYREEGAPQWRTHRGIVKTSYLSPFQNPVRVETSFPMQGGEVFF